MEDEWLIAMDHAEVLGSAGHDVVGPLRRVDGALDRIAETPPDAALLDIRLDGDTSYRVAEALIALHIPFAFVTGLVETDLPDRFAPVPLLSKPVTPAHLLNMVDRLLMRGT